jgi:cell division protein FtsQ
LWVEVKQLQKVKAMTKAIHLDAPAKPLLQINPKLKLGMGLAGMLVAFGLLVLLITDGLYNPRNYNISKITLSGDAAHVDRVSLRQSVIEMIDGNYFSLDANKITKALHALPWVEKARLRRQWPDTLMIDIEEYQPIALWGKDRWLTTTGKLVALPLPENIALPQLNGPPDEVDQVWPKYQKWASLFARNGLRLRNLSLSRQHLYTLDIEYNTRHENSAKGFKMILSESNADSQLNAFLESRRQALIEYPGLIKTVDLRYPSGFSISLYEPDQLVKTNK